METRLDALIAEIESLDEIELDRVFAFVADLKAMHLAGKDVSADARRLRQRLQEKYGVPHFGSIVSVVDEAREERLNDLMGRD